MTAAKPRPVLLVLAAALTATLLTGCGRWKFTRQNYSTIYEGQPADAVRRKLGPPQTEEGDIWTYIRETPDYYSARIRFQDGLVVDKSWSDRRQEPVEP